MKNIVLILLDDLGFNDVSFHGSPQIQTPNMDEIAHTGVKLFNYHAQPVCSPTRASLLSGRHAIHHGIYMPFARGSNLRLNLSYTLLPAALANLGYESHAVGKWHLGQNELAALPTGRGFDSFYGYWTGAETHFSHFATRAYDFADQTETCLSVNGTYGTRLFAKRAVEIIEGAKASRPFFLYLALQNVHWPLEAPAEYLDRFANTTGGDKRRQAVAAMASIADEAIGNVTSAMKRTGIWESTHLILLSDNGGPTNGNEGTWSSNYPMRGGKNTLWEGGTRVMAAMRGPAIGPRLIGTISYRQVHVTDWFHTLLSLASDSSSTRRRQQHVLPPNEPPFLDGDGIDITATLRTGAAVRSETLLECHPPPAPWHSYTRTKAGGVLTHHIGYLPVGHDVWPPHKTSVGKCLDACASDDRCLAVTFEDAEALPSNATMVKCYSKSVLHKVVPRSADQLHGNGLIVGEWKLLHLGPTRPEEEAGWVVPPGMESTTVKYSLGCDLTKQPKSVNASECVIAPCLFNVASDPCEYNDLFDSHPEIVASLSKRLKELQATAVPAISTEDCGCKPIVVDGAWRPCDAPLREDEVVEEPPPPGSESESGYGYGRGEYVAPPSAPM